MNIETAEKEIVNIYKKKEYFFMLNSEKILSFITTSVENCF